MWITYSYNVDTEFVYEKITLLLIRIIMPKDYVPKTCLNWIGFETEYNLVIFYVADTTRAFFDVETKKKYNKTIGIVVCKECLTMPSQ